MLAASCAELTETLRGGRARRRRGLGPREVALLDLAQDAAQERRRSSSSPTSWRSASSSTTSASATRRSGVIHSALSGRCPAASRTTSRRPKPNNYRSLHTGVIGPERQRIEIQIRTARDARGGRARRRRALGLQAAGGRRRPRRRNTAGCASCSTSSSMPPTPEEFLEHTKLEMFQDQVFCFTPKGELIALPRGATPVDFAYAVHSQIGDTCVGAKINGRLLPLRTQLQNGDQVEIITSQGADAVADLGALCRHRQGARPHPPLHPHPAARAVPRSRPRRSCRRRSARRARTSPRRPLEAVLKQLQLRRPSTISTSRSARGWRPAREVVNAAFRAASPKTQRQGRPARARGAAQAASAQRAWRCRSAA